jgi:hypothetical protein
MAHILFNINIYIDMWIKTQLFHDLYLKSMEGHLSMIDCEKLSCKSLCNFFFCINKLVQVVTLVEATNVSPHVFYHIKTSKC